MLLFLRYRLLCGLLRLLVRCGVDERDLEAVVLRRQLKILARGGTRPRLTTADRALWPRRPGCSPGTGGGASWSARTPSSDGTESSLGRRPRGPCCRPGRPLLDPAIKELIRRLGRGNPRWGYLRIRGELLKLGIDVSHTTVATVLRQSGLGPAPRRIGPTWTEFLRLQAYGLLSDSSRSDQDDNPEDVASDAPEALTRSARTQRRPSMRNPSMRIRPHRAHGSSSWCTLDGGHR